MADWAVRYSVDYGASFFYPVATSTATGGGTPGFDTARFSAPSIGAGAASVYRATTQGGTYSAIGAALTSTYAIILVIPWYTPGSSSVKNTSTTAPGYYVGSAAAVSGAALWSDDGAGSRTDITPDISGTKGLGTGPNCLTCWKGTYLAEIASFSGTKKLVTSTNGGTSWTDRGASGTSSGYVRLLRLQTTPKVFYYTSGATLKVTRDWGVTLASKTTPATTLLGVEPYG